MKPESSITTNRQGIIAIISLILFFITIIVTVSTLVPLLSRSVIAPINTSSDPHLSQINLTDVENQLKAILENSYGLSPAELSQVQAVIREDTINYNLNKDKVESAKFIIDLNEPKLTYLVNDEIENQFISFTCPSIDLVQDPNVFCIGYGNQSTIDANLGKYLPYSNTIANDIEYTLWQDLDDNNRPRLEAYANICNDEQIAKAIKSDIAEWLKSHGIDNPNVIPLNMPYSYCDEHQE